MVAGTILAAATFFAFVQPAWRQPIEPVHSPPAFYPFAMTDEQICDVCRFYEMDDAGGCSGCTGTGGETYIEWPSWDELGFPKPDTK